MIITLHRICEKLPLTFKVNEGLYTTTESLYKFINNAKKNKKKFISLEKYLTSRKKKDYISITFDDGYKDNYLLAYPILKRMKIPFTLYITTNFIENQSLPWWFLLEDYLALKKISKNDYKKENSVYLEKIFKDKSLNDSFLNIRNKILNKKFNIEKLYNFKELTEKRLGSKIFMNWEQINNLNQDKLVTFGAHSVSHKRLSKCSLKESTEEIENSKKIIEEKIKTKIQHFAYPYGGIKDFAKKDIQILKKNNFKSAVTTIGRSSQILNRNKFLISRFPLAEGYNNPSYYYEKFNQKDLKNLLKDFMIYTYKKVF